MFDTSTIEVKEKTAREEILKRFASVFATLAIASIESGETDEVLESENDLTIENNQDFKSLKTLNVLEPVSQADTGI